MLVSKHFSFPFSLFPFLSVFQIYYDITLSNAISIFCGKCLHILLNIRLSFQLFHFLLAYGGRMQYNLYQLKSILFWLSTYFFLKCLCLGFVFSVYTSHSNKQRSSFQVILFFQFIWFVRCLWFFFLLFLFFPSSLFYFIFSGSWNKKRRAFVNRIFKGNKSQFLWTLLLIESSTF